MDLSQFKPVIEPVEVDGVSLFVRSMKAKDFLTLSRKAKSDEETGFLIVLLSLCDDQGNRALRDDQLEEIESLPLHVLNALLQAALSVNKLNESGFEDVKKKRETTPSVS